MIKKDKRNILYIIILIMLLIIAGLLDTIELKEAEKFQKEMENAPEKIVYDIEYYNE